MKTDTSETFVVVLAGGEGTRLAPLTRALYGHDLPKQFAVIAGDRSLLQESVERALRIAPAERVIVIVTAHREAVAREQLAGYGVELLVQPRNLDTGPGMLLPLATIVARSPRARVVFLPSDHFIVDDRPLIDALAATAETGEVRHRLSLVGVKPTGPEVEYGWVVPGRRVGDGAFGVERFVEKPEAAVAEQLWREGGLWNTFISAGPVRVFWDLARRYLPAQAEILAGYTRAIGLAADPAALVETYRTLQPANFSREVLAHARELVVIPVAGTGWSDWGSPKRVFASLAGTPSHTRLVERIRFAAPLAIAG